jgi:DNA-3-methyladenine glycosylase I
VGSIRNRSKITATIGYAQCFLEVQEEFNNFHAYQHRFTGGKAILNRWKRTEEVPARQRRMLWPNI